ncbi:MAG TPA: hypothetical protein VFU55_09990 [Terracidiphilus sp.]|nr:hypothetical protein [Terracidiphilus sp.]
MTRNSLIFGTSLNPVWDSFATDTELLPVPFGELYILIASAAGLNVRLTMEASFIGGNQVL